MTEKKLNYSFAEQLKLATVLIGAALFFIFSDWLWRWDQQFYDIQLRSWTKPVPEDVVIVAVDEASLIQLGRWPWSRNTHATLVNKLKEAGAKSIVLDIIFSEENQIDPEGDKALARAIQNAGNVILPVLVEQPRLGAPLKETLPISPLIQAGAKLGHVHIELDPDGIARSVYLYEGLGDPHWPNISLTTLQMEEGNAVIAKPVKKSNNSTTWHRDIHRLIPYLGPPGHFPRISYKDIINGNFSTDNISGKTVLVGVTATGLGDALPSPVSGLTHPMPGIEINANIYSALKSDQAILLIDQKWRIAVTIFLVILPVFLFPRVSPGSALFLTVSLIALTALFSLYLLTFHLTWFPPLAAVISLMISYPVWSWRRLHFTVNYLHEQLKILNNEPGLLSTKKTLNLKHATAFLASVLPCDGWAIFNENGIIKHQRNWKNTPLPEKLRINLWQTTGNCIWLKTNLSDHAIALQLKQQANISPVQTKLLIEISSQLYSRLADERRTGTVELIESQILQVQSATARLRALRLFVSESLEQMADGVVIISPLGDVIFFNKQASELFSDISLNDASILHIIDQCEIEEDVNWQHSFIQVLEKHLPMQLQATLHNDRDILIQFAPLIGSEEGINGVIVNFSDISHIKEIERKRTEFINFLSHDLRSPLSSAIAIIEMSKHSNSPIDDKKISRLKQYTERALNLTEGFVQLARAENINAIDFRESNLADVILNATDQLWETSQEKNIQINVDTHTPIANILADARLIERVIINLLSNAIKYSPANSNIDIKLSDNDMSYEISVNDEGPGIPDNEISRLFDRFHRLDQTQNNASGIGLGLTFVKTVIEAHHGSVIVKNREKAGSTFIVSLPKYVKPQEN